MENIELEQVEIEGVVLNFGVQQNPEDIGLEGLENPVVEGNPVGGGGPVVNPGAELVVGNPEAGGGDPMINPGVEDALGDGGNIVNAVNQDIPEGGA